MQIFKIPFFVVFFSNLPQDNDYTYFVFQVDSYVMLAWSHALPLSNNHLFLFQSMLNFLNDPTGEMPWEEEEGTEDIRHIKTGQVSNEL